MAKIGITEIDAAYRFGVEAYFDRISIPDAVKKLVAETGMNKGSADDYIRNVGHLLGGRSYKRTLSNLAAGFFLKSIQNDFGDEKLRKAVSAIQSHIEYYRKISVTNLKSLHEICMKFVNPEDIPLQQSEMEKIDNLTEESLALSHAERLEILSNSSKIPETALVLSRIFVRNPHVKAEVMVRANGRCEGCGNQAPFQRLSNGTPYLEVHHKVPLAVGGEDTVENSMALCPNCHREAHFGQDQNKFQIKSTISK